MIRIPISEEQKKEIQKIYWDWIRRYHMKELLTIIKTDSVFSNLILKDKTNIEEEVKKYLFSDYNQLYQIKKKIDGQRMKKKYIRDDTKDFLLERYANYRDSQAAKVINVLDVTVCPYCNQNHVNVVYEKGGKIRLWGDLDHFYDKGTYPELAICLYNLVPVCKVCNQLKGSKKGKIVSPYNLEKKTNIRFETTFDEKYDLGYLQGKSQNFNITINENELCDEDREEIEIFDLKNRYSQLRRNVQEIIIKSRAYDGLYEEMLKTEFQITEEELDSYIFGYTDNHYNRVLSKFNRDIMNEFRN